MRSRNFKPFASANRSLFRKLNKSFSFFFQQLLDALKSFIVVERDGSIIACAALFPFFEDKSGEVAAIAVSEECRGQGQGDKLLGKIIAN